MNKNRFGEQKASYIIENAPLIGEYEYYYTNSDVLMKVDQFGINTIQFKPPMDVALIKRETTKVSPWKVYFSMGGKVYNNFDFISSKTHKIEFTPTKATYTLNFNNLTVNTTLFVTEKDCRVIMQTEFINTANKDLKLTVMPLIVPYVNDLLMAPWDKPEWYTKTAVNSDKDYTIFTTDRFSVSGDIKQRRYCSCVFNGGENSNQISLEKVSADTLNFSTLKKLSNVKEQENGLYAFSQSYSSRYELTLKKGENKVFTQVLSLVENEKDRKEDIEKSKQYFDNNIIEKEFIKLDKFYENLFNVDLVKTADSDFNSFINAFLPLELYWVSKLDRGWPTGMRGTRDASNDFMGMLSYDKKECRNILLHLFNCQRSDGWFPRQVPLAENGKFDLRPFMDGGCFVLEFMYNYITYTHDFNLLKENATYYDNKEKVDTVLTHIIKIIEFYLNKDNIGEHGLVKINGGDWLDTLSGAGLKGKGETVMVTCQLIMGLKYVAEILEYLDKEKYADTIKSYRNKAKQFASNINKYSLNEKGFYNGVYTDNGEWIFSNNDPDGECRPYVPTNAYAIASGVSRSPKKVIANLKALKCEAGYRLFYPAMGKKKIELVGKMGTGDLQAGFGENGNPYNHGAHGFFLRAIAKVKDRELFYNVLNYMLPYNPKYHSPKTSYSAPYAIINVYQSVPMFNGRAGFSFLTGSVAMIHRAIYNWMAGITFTLNGITINPCVPKEYENMNIKYTLANGKILEIEFVGYGTKVKKANVGNIVDNNLILQNKDLEKDLKLKIILE